MERHHLWSQQPDIHHIHPPNTRGEGFFISRRWNEDKRVKMGFSARPRSLLAPCSICQAAQGSPRQHSFNQPSRPHLHTSTALLGAGGQEGRDQVVSGKLMMKLRKFHNRCASIPVCVSPSGHHAKVQKSDITSTLSTGTEPLAYSQCSPPHLLWPYTPFTTGFAKWHLGIFANAPVCVCGWKCDCPQLSSLSLFKEGLPPWCLWWVCLAEGASIYPSS